MATHISLSSPFKVGFIISQEQKILNAFASWGQGLCLSYFLILIPRMALSYIKISWNIWEYFFPKYLPIFNVLLAISQYTQLSIAHNYIAWNLEKDFQWDILMF